MFNPQERSEQSWWSLARCNVGTGALLEVFFSEQLDDIAWAKAFCAECPVRSTCLQGALARREPWGVWGGELISEGRVLSQKRKRGRPSKEDSPETAPAEARSA